MTYGTKETVRWLDKLRILSREGLPALLRCRPPSSDRGRPDFKVAHEQSAPDIPPKQ
jgi:hypothetical protein